MDRAGAVIRVARSFPAQQPSAQASRSHGLPETSAAAGRLPRDFARYLREPLVQRPAGSAGKQGICTLTFTSDHGKTQLRHSFVTHPFHLTRPWYLDPALPGMAVMYIQTPAGGLIQGDRADLYFDLGPATQVHVTNQAAEKIHAMTANCALQQISFVLGPGAYAEYYPEPIILFPGSRFGQELCVELHAGASFFGAEIFLSRRALDGACFEALTTSLRVQDASGTLLVRERSLVLPAQQDLAGPGLLGSYPVWGQAFLLGPVIPLPWARELHTLLSAEGGGVCGVTLLPGECGIGVKVVGAEVSAVRRILFTAWHFLRSRHVGAPASLFPK